MKKETSSELPTVAAALQQEPLPTPVAVAGIKQEEEEVNSGGGTPVRDELPPDIPAQEIKPEPEASLGIPPQQEVTPPVAVKEEMTPVPVAEIKQEVDMEAMMEQEAPSTPTQDEASENPAPTEGSRSGTPTQDDNGSITPTRDERETTPTRDEPTVAVTSKSSSIPIVPIQRKPASHGFEFSSSSGARPKRSTLDGWELSNNSFWKN